jgi:PRTRC genetic system protein B
VGRIFHMDTTHAALTLRHAILVYGSAVPMGQGIGYATLHDVKVDKQGVAQILPGVPATQHTISGVLLALGAARRAGFLPASVLVRETDGLVWWKPPGRRALFFKTKEASDGIGTRSQIVPHPGLVFKAKSDGHWQVFAVKGAQRPTPETRLCHAPYYNVWSDGRICVGNVSVPDSSDMERMAAWEDAFFDSYFTHANNQGVRMCKHHGGLGGLWRELLDETPRRFPQKYLLEIDNLTLQGVIERW